MRRSLTVLFATTALLGATPVVASAQPWTSLDQRQVQLDQRIDAGVQSGQLSRSEAAQLRAEFRDIEQLEARYRADGLSMEERRELDMRFNQLSERIRFDRHDDQRRGDRWDNPRQDPGVGPAWTSVNQRQAELDQRIDAGVRSGQLSRAEAAQLRAQFRDIAQLEARYRADGLSPDERRDLDRRFDQLSERIRFDRHDDQRRGGGRWENLGQRQAQFEQRLNRAVRDGRITARQAASLRAEYRSIAMLEQRYGRDGIDPSERADLDRRFDRLQVNFRASVRASQYREGYGEAPNLFDYLFGGR